MVEWENQAELVYAGLEPGNVSFLAREPAMLNMGHAGSGAGAQQAPIKDGDRRFRHGPKSTAINAMQGGEGEFDPVVWHPSAPRPSSYPCPHLPPTARLNAPRLP